MRSKPRKRFECPFPSCSSTFDRLSLLNRHIVAHRNARLVGRRKMIVQMTAAGVTQRHPRRHVNRMEPSTLKRHRKSTTLGSRALPIYISSSEDEVEDTSTLRIPLELSPSSEDYETVTDPRLRPPISTSTPTHKAQGSKTFHQGISSTTPRKPTWATRSPFSLEKLESTIVLDLHTPAGALQQEGFGQLPDDDGDDEGTPCPADVSHRKFTERPGRVEEIEIDELASDDEIPCGTPFVLKGDSERGFTSHYVKKSLSSVDPSSLSVQQKSWHSLPFIDDGHLPKSPATIHTIDSSAIPLPDADADDPLDLRSSDEVELHDTTQWTSLADDTIETGELDATQQKLICTLGHVTDARPTRARQYLNSFEPFMLWAQKAMQQDAPGLSQADEPPSNPALLGTSTHPSEYEQDKKSLESQKEVDIGLDLREENHPVKPNVVNESPRLDHRDLATTENVMNNPSEPPRTPSPCSRESAGITSPSQTEIDISNIEDKVDTNSPVSHHRRCCGMADRHLEGGIGSLERQECLLTLLDELRAYVVKGHQAEGNI